MVATTAQKAGIMRTNLRLLLATALAGTALALGGCSVDIGTSNTTPDSVASDQVAESAEDSVEDEGGTRPEIDCGSEDFALEDGASRTCALTDPDTGEVFDVEVKLSNVAYTDFAVEVDVASEPRG